MQPASPVSVDIVLTLARCPPSTQADCLRQKVFPVNPGGERYRMPVSCPTCLPSGANNIRFAPQGSGISRRDLQLQAGLIGFQYGGPAVPVLTIHNLEEREEPAKSKIPLNSTTSIPSVGNISTSSPCG
ncbi:hypothetical protein EYF80_011215 [Liparis tanakae]|uniref:Uncharacterized protein n=1 Tax=Liparis tanakae TaxID=230148 RepID=A0A4Z2IKQ1_9TELE|nr:hypothetical protein EYF80_011215 [Liparis tanakae]